MDEYFLICKDCGKRTQITQREAKAYAIMRFAASGGAASCTACSGPVIGDIVEKKQEEKQ